MADQQIQWRLAAILAADIAHYTKLMAADEDATIADWHAARADIIDPTIAEYRGRIVKHTGDGFLAEFPTVTNAVRAAVAMQTGLAARNDGAAAERRMDFRMGINLGEIAADDEDIHGDGVNLAARLESIADPGGICVSANVYDQVRRKLDLAFDDLGERELKNVAEPVRVYRIALGEHGAAPAVGTRPRASSRPSIAVLPFDNLSPDPDQAFFADGVVEDIITALSKFRSLTVIARNSTFTYKGKSVGVAQVAKELGVRYVLEGSVRRAGERVRVTAQLIDAETGTHLWAEKYDRDLTDIFDLQDEITRTIIAEIEPELESRERTRAHDKPAVNLDAWELLQRGLWHRYKFVASDNAEAERHFRAAIELDPDFAEARAQLAMLGYAEVVVGQSQDREATLEWALGEARRAVALDDRNANAFCALGFVYSIMNKGPESVPEFDRAIQLNPNLAQAHYGRAVGLTLSPDAAAEDIIAAATAAIELSPNDPLVWAFINIRGMALLSQHDDDAALAEFDAAARRPNTAFWPFVGKAAALANLGRIPEAERALAEARQRYPDLSIASVSAAVGPNSVARVEFLIESLRRAGLD